MIKYVTADGDTVDYICWKQYGTHENRVAEQLLEANPGLAARGPVLPAGVIIYLPEVVKAEATEGVRLWS
jgi:phage tail protein X